MYQRPTLIPRGLFGWKARQERKRREAKEMNDVLTQLYGDYRNNSKINAKLLEQQYKANKQSFINTRNLKYSDLNNMSDYQRNETLRDFDDAGNSYIADLDSANIRRPEISRERPLVRAEDQATADAYNMFYNQGLDFTELNNNFSNDYSSLGSFSRAFGAARKRGLNEFTYNGKRYGTLLATTPPQDQSSGWDDAVAAWERLSNYQEAGNPGTMHFLFSDFDQPTSSNQSNLSAGDYIHAYLSPITYVGGQVGNYIGNALLSQNVDSKDNYNPNITLSSTASNIAQPYKEAAPYVKEAALNAVVPGRAAVQTAKSVWPTIRKWAQNNSMLFKE